MAGFDSERFDAFLKLAQFRHELRQCRGARHWQALLSAWIGLGILVTQNEVLTIALRWMVASVSSIVLCAWIIWHAVAAERDQATMFGFHDKAAELVGVLAPTVPKIKPWFRHPPVWMQIGTTLLLCLLLISLK